MGDRQEPPADCTYCGTCCFSESPRHARVTGDDYARLGDDAESLVAWIGNVAFMRLRHLGDASGPRGCVGLALDAPHRTLTCSIYERRPQVCRDLERGGGACRGELAGKAERPPQALLRARSLATRRP